MMSPMPFGASGFLPSCDNCYACNDCDKSPMPFGASGFLPLEILAEMYNWDPKSPMPFGASGFLPSVNSSSAHPERLGLQCLSALPAFSPAYGLHEFLRVHYLSPMPFGASGFLPAPWFSLSSPSPQESPMPFGASGFLPVMCKIGLGLLRRSPMPFGASGFLPCPGPEGCPDRAEVSNAFRRFRLSPHHAGCAHHAARHAVSNAFRRFRLSPLFGDSGNANSVVQVSNAFRRFRLSPRLPGCRRPLAARCRLQCLSALPAFSPGVRRRRRWQRVASPMPFGASGFLPASSSLTTADFIPVSNAFRRFRLSPPTASATATATATVSNAFRRFRLSPHHQRSWPIGRVWGLQCLSALPAFSPRATENTRQKSGGVSNAFRRFRLSPLPPSLHEGLA